MRQQEGGAYDPTAFIAPETVAATIAFLLAAPRDATLTDVTVRPMSFDIARTSRSATVRGIGRNRPATASVAIRPMPRLRCAARPTAGAIRFSRTGTAGLPRLDL